MLAYVFWHWKQNDVLLSEYETRQRAFHTALNTAKPSGFLESWSVALSQKPWDEAGTENAEVYEDWYLVQDFGALGDLNDGAISASRAEPHAAAAVVAAGGTGGLYGLRLGSVLHQPQLAHWFSKPISLSYQELFAQITPVVEQVHGALWIRQMVLGPAPKFCLHTTASASFTPAFNIHLLPLRTVYPEMVQNGKVATV